VSDEKHTGHFVSFYEQWSALFRPTNWDDMDVVRIFWERDAQLGTFSVDLAVLGVGVRWAWVYTETDYGMELRRRAAEVKAAFEDGK